jgi:sigma-B regulation protein RsbU (phosphoserine phosphatase)
MTVKVKRHLFIALVFCLGSLASFLVAYGVYVGDIVFAFARLSGRLTPYWSSVLIGSMGMAFTLLVSGGLIYLTGEGERIAALAEARAAELLAAKDNLEKEYADRLQAEAALEQERNLLRTLLDILPSRIFAKNTESKFILANLAQARIFGLNSAQEIYGKTTFDLIPDEGSERRLADDRQVMESGKSFINREEFAVNADGNRRWSLTTKVPLRNSRGDIVGIVGTSTDITERKLAAEAVEKYAEELQKRNNQMEDDLQMAREIQQAFIPQQFPRIRKDDSSNEEALSFCHRYVPTATLAGDFFEILPISDEQVGVMICDVMGHGVRASLFTAYLRGLIEELTPFATDPGALLTELNKGLMAILRRTEAPMFASAFYLVVDVLHDQIRYANAGHPVPFRVQREVDIVESLQSGSDQTGVALGLIQDFGYTTCTSDFRPGDSIMLYTDGVFEVHDSHGQEFGEDRLLAGVQERIHLSADELFDEVLGEIRQFSGKSTFADDVCLVAVEYCVPQSDLASIDRQSRITVNL